MAEPFAEARKRLARGQRAHYLIPWIHVPAENPCVMSAVDLEVWRAMRSLQHAPPAPTLPVGADKGPKRYIRPADVAPGSHD